MAFNVRSGDRDQLFLMPASMLDWLPEDHLAFFMIDVVSQLDLSEFYAAHRLDGRGGAVYDPEMMLGVLLYAYCVGERSSRRIERKLSEDVAFRVLAVNQQPDHATLARFRRRHQSALAGIFGQVLGLCVKAGLVDAGIVAIDGTKISADASYFANRKREALAKEILAEAEAVDQADKETLIEQGHGGTDATSWSGQRDRRQRIRAALEELDARPARDYQSKLAERAKKEAALGHKLTGPKPSPDAARRPGAQRANTTDPHSRIIAQQSKGVLQGYNAQAAATSEQVIIAAEVTATTNDQPHFIPMTSACVENLQKAGLSDQIGVFLADAGYWTAANGTADLGNAKALIATRKSPAKTKREEPDETRWEVLAKVNRGELSQREAGKMLGVSYTWIRDQTKRYFGTDGKRRTPPAEPEPEVWIPIIKQVMDKEISRRAACDLLNISAGRVVTMIAHVKGEAVDPQIAYRQMESKLAEPGNEALYKKRAATIEPCFGNIKQNLRFRRFRLRGFDGVQAEWRIMCSIHNLLKLKAHTT